ncbi:hypothetical protein ASZ90_007580 [hydrocarbon metagenome]|uniref:Autotransporter domain-containing protein n=1 Tax=hydrocarbon metagenome TaxID=938273 RepID=A0A0W8FP47_9ZZZZ
MTVNNYIAETVGETTTITGGTISATAFTQTDGGFAGAYAAGVYVDDAPTAVTVTNYGDITASGTALADMPYGSETVPDYDEEGYAYGDAAGIYIHHTAAATVNNIEGTISATGEARGYGGYSDVVGVNIDALWDESDDTAVINNSGTISASASSYNYGYGGFVTGVGAGGFDQVPFLGYGGAFARGVYVDDADTVTVNNYVAETVGETTTITGGTISSTAFNQTDGGLSLAFGAGVFIEDAGTVTVTSYGDITSSATALGDMPYGSQTVPDYDEGIAIAATAGVLILDAETATVNNIGGTITGTATASGEYAVALGGGVSMFNISAPRTAMVNNTGTISGSGTGNGYGSEGEGDGDGYGYGGGVYIVDAETATVFNGAFIDEEKNLIITGGTISGTGTGNGYNQNNGYGYGYGVNIENASTATVTNYGTIIGTGTGSSDGSYGYGYGYGVYMNNIYGIETAIVTNIGGTISGKGTGLSEDAGSGDGYGYGVYMSNVDAAVITNGAIEDEGTPEEVITGGTISGEGVAYNDGYGDGYGIYIYDADTIDITNYGTIIGTGTVCTECTSYSRGIYIDKPGSYDDDDAVHIYNRGTISGKVGIYSDGYTTIENYGTITSTDTADNYYAVELDDGYNNVLLGTGSVINGLIIADHDDLSFTNNYITLEAAEAADVNTMAANQILGFDTMEKTGAGTWVLTGDMDYTDPNYNETESMPINVNEGVLAFGARETTAGVTTDYLTVADGASIGYVITPSATEEAPVDASGALTVTEDADFGGSTVIVIPTPTDANRYLLTTTYENVLTVDGDLTLWSDVTANSAFLTPDLVADNDGLQGVYDLILQRLSFTTGADPSSIPLGEVLDELYGSTDDPDLLALLNALLTEVSESEAQRALAELGGGSHTAFQLMSFDALDKYLGILNNHMGGMGGFGGLANYNSGNGFAVADSSPKLAMTGSGDTVSDVAPILMAAVGNVISQGQAAKGTNWGLWADGYLGTGNRRSDDLIAKYKQNLYGGIVGFDYRIADDLFIGMAGGISRTNVEFDDLLDNGHMDSYHGSLYLCYNGKPWYAAGVFTYAYNKYNLDRYITTLGPTQVANSDYSGNEYTGYAEVGYKISAGNVEIRPLAAFQVDYLEQEAFTETGAGIYNLNVDKRDTGSYKSFLGVNVTGNIKLSENAAFKPEFRLKWSHEFSNDDHMINAQFEGMGSSYFSVAAEQLSRDTAIIGVGLSLLFNKHVGAYIQYDAELNSDYVNHTGLAGLRLAW